MVLATRRTAEPLTIVAERVQIEDINKILLGTHTLEGQLDATVRLEGTMAAPRVTGRAASSPASSTARAFDRLDASGSFDEVSSSRSTCNLQAGEFGQFTARRHDAGPVRHDRAGVHAAVQPARPE